MSRATLIDAARLVPLVGAARVVALGEGAHQIEELHRVRDEVLRLLVGDLGFTALVVESGFPESLAVDAWLQGAPGAVEQVAREGFSYGFGESESVRRMLTWMRERGVRIYGMDLGGDSVSPGPAVRALLDRLPQRPGDDDLLARSDLGGRARAPRRWAALDPASRQRLLTDLSRLVVRASEVDDPIVERCASALAGFVAEQTQDVQGPRPRELVMADTVRWVLEREERILVSAHNAHLRRALLDGAPSLGGLLDEQIGDDLVVIGTTYGHGPEVRYVDRSARPFDWTVELTERVLLPQTAEARLDRLAGPAPLVDLRTAEGRLLVEGAEGTQAAGGLEACPDLTAAYDALLHLHTVHRVPGAFERLRADLAGYPPTRTVEVVDHPAGLAVPDPYRWLEAEDDEVAAWQRWQAELATQTVFEGQDRDRLRRLVERYDAGERPTLPRYGGGQWFRAGVGEIVTADEPFGTGRSVVRLADLVEESTPVVLSWLAPSPDGRTLAVGVCTDGSEHNTIRLIEVATGKQLAAPGQVLHSAWAGGVSWSADGAGFWFLALTGTPEEFAQAVFHHRLDTGATTVEPIPVPAGSREYTLVQPSADGRWLVASHRVGSPVPIAVRDLTDTDAGWRPFVTDVDGTVAGHIVGDRYVAITDVGAGRGRLVAIPLDAADPNDQRTWTELVPEGPTVLRSLTPVGDHLYLSEFDATFARLRVLDRAGAVVQEVPLPGRGALAAPFFPLTGLAVGTPAPVFVFAFSTLVSSWGVHGHRPGAAATEQLLAPAVTLDAVVEVGAAPARDGTRVPFHLVRRADAEGRAPEPMLITAYGAANVPTLPQYQPDLAAFVDAGGTLVQAYLRGGGELGRDWYLAAHRATKHVRDDDLVAVAEHLLATGRTTSDKLALTGGSDGGLMCGVAVTTRPDLWRAVLPRAPLLDLVAGMRDPYLDFVIRKAWGDPDDPVDVRRMIGRSPYELVQPAVLPAVYVQAGAADPRCRPWHARKFVARLQAAQQGTAPILLHVFEHAGHGAATSPAVQREQDAEWLAFLVGCLDLPV